MKKLMNAVVIIAAIAVVIHLSLAALAARDKEEMDRHREAIKIQKEVESEGGFISMRDAWDLTYKK
ncbi:TPA: hypothetical protein DDW69_02230 [candidate division CPR2 bacterium]|uniref:Uncharacterized protein n=1 Tax=candidate division CPR2 bacterium GW2011_GWC1_41_48 TaxID=1618344 RepID=A0A0G0WA09_UNCC2|nr:MAG: hypothetical protein UT47_C0001G0249 [candidate division CPR2 bacterium GW2011_GWC2_39_35]KKR28404.1 MAG: hypothetical protein UT60_C0021G0008 [candidate division CPR2 bacterium GW2011_GWD2_39_7]KKR28409.1 MAG: hypothetical protein UT59_C0028G0003 [candidate division CPR2 bacterium GW2011_GWD1_39_7]KKS09844.1 MAG: hypothetical protein UU65_C0001G0249 [candidate division CPR2 bacterium GW2011_GWC1_41_48]OGB60669.1 MAG: hypothetical protein A2Y27_00530 [candidate division CPR2 bacterium G